MFFQWLVFPAATNFLSNEKAQSLRVSPRSPSLIGLQELKVCIYDLNYLLVRAKEDVIDKTSPFEVCTEATTLLCCYQLTDHNKVNKKGHPGRHRAL